MNIEIETKQINNEKQEISLKPESVHVQWTELSVQEIKL
jgi:hypothetical protein